MHRPALWSLSRFRKAVGEILDEIPAPLLRGLSGGVVVMPQIQRRQGDPRGVYVLGEYLVNPAVGHMIVIYYGSFRRTLAGATWARVRRELRRTIRHELRHHVENLAGVDDLEREDMAWLEWWSQLHGGPGKRGNRHE